MLARQRNDAVMLQGMLGSTSYFFLSWVEERVLNLRDFSASTANYGMVYIVEIKPSCGSQWIPIWQCPGS